jgi:hypothetical protein
LLQQDTSPQETVAPTIEKSMEQGQETTQTNSKPQQGFNDLFYSYP